MPHLQGSNFPSLYLNNLASDLHLCMFLCNETPPQDYGGMLVCRAQGKAACPKVRSSEDVVLNQVLSLNEVAYIGKYQPGKMAN